MVVGANIGEFLGQNYFLLRCIKFVILFVRYKLPAIGIMIDDANIGEFLGKDYFFFISRHQVCCLFCSLQNACDGHHGCRC